MTAVPTQHVTALFLDYDGTISPIDGPESNSDVLHQNEAVLSEISKKIPIAIITTKDLPFIMKRTQFAHAWAGLGGLETKIRDSRVKRINMKKNASHIDAALRYADSFTGEGLKTEKKRFLNGNVIAFSVDWRKADDPTLALKKASQILSYCQTIPIVTTTYENQPFFDAFPCHIDKGKALLALKEELGLSKGILYMGDSTLDNSAFDNADFAVGVLHGENSPTLHCDFYIKFEHVPHFLRNLLQNDFLIESSLDDRHRPKLRYFLRKCQ
jgi:HAD superfamily hydrolase (TIGR01484 family)